MKWIFKYLLAFCGLVLFGWYVSRVGLESVWKAILSLGPAAPLVLLPYLVVYLVDCLAWKQTLATRIPYLTLLRIRWAGESLNNLVPSAYVGGEALKVVLLKNRNVPASEGATAAVVSKTAQTVAQLVFILLASAVFLVIARDQPTLRSALIFICAAGCACIAALFWIQAFGLFRVILAVSQWLRIRPGALERRKEKLRELDTTILGFYRKQPRRFYASTLLYLCGWMLDSVEIYLVSRLLGMPITWAEAIVMEAFTGVAKAIGMWLPGSVGVQESGIVLIGRLAGLPPTLAAAYAIIRRIRELIFIAVGMLLLYSLPSKEGATQVASKTK